MCIANPLRHLVLLCLSAIALADFWSRKCWIPSHWRTLTTFLNNDGLIHVILQALVRSAEYYHNQLLHHSSQGAIFGCTTGVVFIGTPHRGSSKASLAKLVAKAIKGLDVSFKLLDILESSADILEHVRNSFDSMRKDLFIACLYEELPMPVVGMVCRFSAPYAFIDVLFTNSRLFLKNLLALMGRMCWRSKYQNEIIGNLVKFASRSEKAYEIVSYHIQKATKIAHLGNERRMFKCSPLVSGLSILLTYRWRKVANGQSKTPQNPCLHHLNIAARLKRS